MNALRLRSRSTARARSAGIGRDPRQRRPSSGVAAAAAPPPSGGGSPPRSRCRACAWNNRALGDARAWGGEPSLSPRRLFFGGTGRSSSDEDDRRRPRHRSRPAEGREEEAGSRRCCATGSRRIHGRFGAQHATTNSWHDRSRTPAATTRPVFLGPSWRSNSVAVSSASAFWLGRRASSTTPTRPGASKPGSNVSAAVDPAESSASDPVPEFQDTDLPLWFDFGPGDDSDPREGSRPDGTGAAPRPPPPPLSKLLAILIPEAKWLTLALAALTVSTAATMQFPQAIGEAIDILSAGVAASDAMEAAQAIGVDGGVDGSVDGSGDASSATEGVANADPSERRRQLDDIVLYLASCFAVGSVATFGHSALFDGVGQKVGAQLRKKLFAELIRRDRTFFDQNRAGELANRLSADVHEVAEHLVQNVAYFLQNLVRAAAAIVQMSYVSTALTVHFAPLPLLLGGCASFWGGHVKHWSKRHLDALAHSTHVAAERFGGIATVLSFGQRDAERGRYAGAIEAAYGHARRAAAFQGALLGSSYAVGNGASLGVLFLGSGYVLSGEMTPGSLAGMCMYAGHLAEAVVELSEAAGGILRAQGSGARLFQLLEGGASVDVAHGAAKGNAFGSNHVGSSKLPPSYETTVRFEGVEFAYPSHKHAPILNGVSFALNSDEILAITGPSGGGKSSIVSLLMRFYEPNAGRITLDGACIAANAHRFILDLPDQYDTIVGERGASISGGQKQRLCIARALLTKPRILALDEGTSALDGPTEQDFLRRLRDLLESKESNISAVVFITHKKSVLEACDRVAVLSDGRITETGALQALDRIKGGQLRKLMMGLGSALK
ncbi:hypothetical protein ACHAWF_013798 [Thalassiosira exigua]